MLELRLLSDKDVPLAEVWLNKEHVKRWYEIPRLGIKIDDWISEIKERNGEFRWITYLIAMWQNHPIGLCHYYKCGKGASTQVQIPHTESVYAGALGIRLAGSASYRGKVLEKPYIGEDTRLIQAKDIVSANRLMYASSVLTLILAVLFLIICLGVVFLGKI